jgi:hypothetical protein
MAASRHARASAGLLSSGVARILAAAVLTCVGAGVGVGAIELEVGDEAIRSALKIARGSSQSLGAFHRTYVRAISKSDLQEVEILTELRRAVSAAERRQVGEADVDAVRRIMNAIAPFRQRVSIVARFRFSPQTALVSLPAYEVAIPAVPGSSEIRALDLRRTPTYQGAGRSTFLAGADVEAVFDAADIGQRQRRIVVRLDGEELGALSVDFASIQ